MQPLNAPQRKKALGSFMLFYILSVGLIVTTILLGMQAPFRQNELFKAQLAIYQNQKKFMDDFSSKMIDTQNLLDSVNRPGVMAELIDGQIASNLNKMNAMIAADSTISKAIYTSIVGNFANLKEAKQQLRNAGNNDVLINSLHQQLADYQNKLTQAYQQINMLNR